LATFVSTKAPEFCQTRGGYGLLIAGGHETIGKPRDQLRPPSVMTEALKDEPVWPTGHGFGLPGLDIYVNAGIGAPKTRQTKKHNNTRPGKNDLFGSP